MWFLVVLIFMIISSNVKAQTNLEIAWHICEQHSTVVGKPSLNGPASLIFNFGYDGCKDIQKLLPSMKSESVNPNQVMMDQLVIDKALKDPQGHP